MRLKRVSIHDSPGPAVSQNIDNMTACWFYNCEDGIDARDDLSINPVKPKAGVVRFSHLLFDNVGTAFKYAQGGNFGGANEHFAITAVNIKTYFDHRLPALEFVNLPIADDGPTHNLRFILAIASEYFLRLNRNQADTNVRESLYDGALDGWSPEDSNFPTPDIVGPNVFPIFPVGAGRDYRLQIAGVDQLGDGNIPLFSSPGVNINGFNSNAGCYGLTAIALGADPDDEIVCVEMESPRRTITGLATLRPTLEDGLVSTFGRGEDENHRFTLDYGVDEAHPRTRTYHELARIRRTITPIEYFPTYRKLLERASPTERWRVPGNERNRFLENTWPMWGLWNAQELAFQNVTAIGGDEYEADVVWRSALMSGFDPDWLDGYQVAAVNQLAIPFTSYNATGTLAPQDTPFMFQCVGGRNGRIILQLRWNPNGPGGAVPTDFATVGLVRSAWQGLFTIAADPAKRNTFTIQLFDTNTAESMIPFQWDKWVLTLPYDPTWMATRIAEIQEEIIENYIPITNWIGGGNGDNPLLNNEYQEPYKAFCKFFLRGNEDGTYTATALDYRNFFIGDVWNEMQSVQFNPIYASTVYHGMIASTIVTPDRTSEVSRESSEQTDNWFSHGMEWQHGTRTRFRNPNQAGGGFVQSLVQTLPNRRMIPDNQQRRGANISFSLL